MTTLTPLRDSILFVWLDAEESETKTTSGIVLKRDLNKNRNRWGRIIAVGPLSQAKVGEYICPDSHVEAWGAKHPDSNQELRDSASDIWRVRDENVLVLSSDYNDTLPLNDNREHTGVQEVGRLGLDL